MKSTKRYQAKCRYCQAIMDGRVSTMTQHTAQKCFITPPKQKTLALQMQASQELKLRRNSEDYEKGNQMLSPSSTISSSSTGRLPSMQSEREVTVDLSSRDVEQSSTYKL